MDRKISIIVFITIFLDLLGFGILIPIQPFLALSFAASPSIVTLLGASYSLIQFLFTPFFGRISDRYGRRPVMLISIATSAIGFFIFAYADSLLLLFLSRMLSGFGGANISCAQAIMADCSHSNQRLKGMGMVNAAVGLGFVVGPALGGLLGAEGFMLPALVAGSLSLLNLFFAWIFLKETKPTSLTTPLLTTKKSLLSNRANLMPLFWLSFLFIMAFALFEQSFGMYLDKLLSLTDTHHSYQQSVKATATFLFIVALLSALIQITALKKLAHFFGEKNLLLLGSLLSAFALAILPLIAINLGFYWLIVPGALFAIGLGVCLPCVASLISEAADDDEQGLALGKSQSYSALGRVIGPAICGVSFEYSHHLPILLAALVFSCGSFLVLKIRRELPC